MVHASTLKRPAGVDALFSGNRLIYRNLRVVDGRK